MSMHGKASASRTASPMNRGRASTGKSGDDWVWSHISASQHADAMQLQQAYGNAYVAQTMRGGVPMAPEVPEEEELPMSPEVPEEEELPMAPAMAEEPEEEELPMAPAMAEVPEEEELPMAPAMAEVPEEEELPMAPAMAEVPEEEELPMAPAMAEVPEEEELPTAPIMDEEEAVNVAVKESNEASDVQGTPEKATMDEEFESDKSGEANHEDLPIQDQPDEDSEFEEEEESGGGASMAAAPMPSFAFKDGGMSGTGPVGSFRVEDDDARPHAYTDGGKTGTIAWAGGGGAGPHGNENVGSIQTEQAPSYIATASGSGPADAYTQGGTTEVTRSYVGAVSGDQGNGFWVSARAAARLNQHEQQHIDSTRKHYNENLFPLQVRLAMSPIMGARIAPDTTSGITAMKAQIRWAASIAAFQAGDNADNYPMKTVDTNDLASGTYPVHAGPGRAQGKRYTQRLKLPGETIPRR